MNIKLQYKRAGLSNTLCISDLEWTTLFGGDRQEESINGIVALLRHSIGLNRRIETIKMASAKRHKDINIY